MKIRTKTDWYRTGEARIVPSWFGFMRAEFFERRDFKDPQTGEVMEYQLRVVRAGRLPAELDGAGSGGFWSTLATPDDPQFGDRVIWRKFCTFFSKRITKDGEKSGN